EFALARAVAELAGNYQLVVGERGGASVGLCAPGHPPIGELNVAAAIEKAISDRGAKRTCVVEVVSDVGFSAIRFAAPVRNRSAVVRDALAKTGTHEQIVQAVVPQAASTRATINAAVAIVAAPVFPHGPIAFFHERRTLGAGVVREAFLRQWRRHGFGCC